MSKIEYLVGNRNFKSISQSPYNNLVCDFICELSKMLIDHPSSHDYPDIKTLAFWCRKKNIDIMKSNFSSNHTLQFLLVKFHVVQSHISMYFNFHLHSSPKVD